MTDYDLIFSMDVDKKRIHVAILNRERLLRKLTVPYDANNLFNYVRKSFPGQKVIFVYEAGPTGYGLYDFLMEKGEECKVAVPSMIPRAPAERVKTNRLDAYRLGIQMRTGELSFVQVPEKKYRDLRHLTRLRLKYSRRVVATKNALKGLYLFEGIHFPEKNWSGEMISELQQVRYRAAVDFKVDQLLKDLEFFHKEELKTKAEIRRFCRSDQEIYRNINYMMSLPGVGWTVSSYILGCFGGYKHLNTITKTSGFLGFGPRENSTGDRIRQGSITAIGDPNARKMIIQGSWIAIKRDAEMKAVYDKICNRNPEKIGKQKAIIAVGRKMVCRIHAVLRDQRFFENRLKKTA